MSGVVSKLGAYASFLAWLAGVYSEPWLSALALRLRKLSITARLRLTATLRGAEYPFSALHPAVRKAIRERGRELREPTPIQVLGIPRILRGENVLLVAPTGSGKTECAFLPVLHFLAAEKEAGRLEPGVYALYITPLRALCSDVARRLRSYVRSALGDGYLVGVWHADIKKNEKTKLAEKPPLVLVTTPESLEAILDTKHRFRKHLAKLRWVIVDEVHELAESKRGLHLLVLLERLKATFGIPRLQRILISATVGDPRRIARLFGGSDGKVRVVRDPGLRRIDAEVVLRRGRSAEELVDALEELMGKGSGYLVFVNTRSEAEELHAELEKRGLGDILVHHGSMGASKRREAERKFKDREVKAVVCTRTLELGIDVGSVERVFQVGSPSLPAYFAQRVGRASHRPGEPARGTLVCLDMNDLVESAAILSMLGRGSFGARRGPPPAMDLALRQALALVLQHGDKAGAQAVAELLGSLLSHVPASWGLGAREALRVLEERGLVEEREVVDVYGERARVLRLGGRFPEAWRKIGAFFTMIPERSELEVRHGRERVGVVDVVNLRLMKRGVVIRLGGKCWRVKELRGRFVIVEPEASDRFAIPVWRGGYVLAPQSVGLEVYRFLSKAARLHRRGASLGEWRSGGVAFRLDEEARRGLAVLAEELSARGVPMPGPRRMVVDRVKASALGALDRFLGVSPEPRATTTVLLYPFGDYIANTLAALLWSSGSVSKVIPRSYGILVRHEAGFDPLEYLLGAGRREVEEAVKSSPYVYVVAFELRRSFGYSRISEKTLEEDRLLREECVRQAKHRFYDVEGALRLLDWVRHGCISVSERLVERVEDLHPVSRYLFEAERPPAPAA